MSFSAIANGIVRESIMDRPKSPEITAGEASGYSVALALVALAQFGSLDRWGDLASVVCAAAVACYTVHQTGRIRVARNNTEQVRVSAMAASAVEPDYEYDQHAADLADLDDEPEGA